MQAERHGLLHQAHDVLLGQLEQALEVRQDEVQRLQDVDAIGRAHRLQRVERLVLGFGGQGAVTLTATINFQDGTSAVFAGLTLEDWFYASPYVVNALGRVYRSTSVSEFDGSNPRLYAADINLIPADQGKRITSISINNAGPGIANIMALSGAAVVSSSAVAAVPSLSEWSLLLLGLLAAGLGMRRLRRP